MGSYGKVDTEPWEDDVMETASDPVVAYRLARLFLAGEGRIAAGDGCPDCGAEKGHTLPCAHYYAAKALQKAGVDVPGYPRGE